MSPELMIFYSGVYSHSRDDATKRKKTGEDAGDKAEQASIEAVKTQAVPPSPAVVLKEIDEFLHNDDDQEEDNQAARKEYMVSFKALKDHLNNARGTIPQWMKSLRSDVRAVERSLSLSSMATKPFYVFNMVG